jgi:hypothetical protein
MNCMKNKKIVNSWFESEMYRERRVKHNIDMNHRTVLPSVYLSHSELHDWDCGECEVWREAVFPYFQSSLKGRHTHDLHGTRFYSNILATKCHRIRTIAFCLRTLRKTASLHGNSYLDQISSSEEEVGTFLRNVRTDVTLHSIVIWAAPGVGPSTPTDWVVGRLRLPVGRVQKAPVLGANSWCW